MANVIKMVVGTDKQGRKGYTTDGNPWNILKGICADENGVILTDDDVFQLHHGNVLVRIMTDGCTQPYFYCPYDKQGVNYKDAKVDGISVSKQG